MIIYHNTKAGFVEDIQRNYFKARIEDAFIKKTGSLPIDARSWANDYARFSTILSGAQVANDVELAIEYHCSPVGRYRIDVIMAGSDGSADNGVIIELKAWDKAEVTGIPNMVQSPLAGGSVTQHPNHQARKYKGMILRFNEDISKAGIQLHPTAFMFNLYRRRPEPLEDARYADLLRESRLFMADDAGELRAYLERLVPRRAKNDVFFILENGRWRPTDELVSRVESMLDGNEEFALLDDQEIAYQVIRHQLLNKLERTTRHVFVVEGGPGTGKSVIAVRLLADILHHKRMGFFVAPNKAFRDALANSLTRGQAAYRDDGEALFKSSWSFHQSDWTKDRRNDVLIVDEAHRLKDSAYQYFGKGMVEDMVRAARISVFFIDESQRVQWQDTGSIPKIKAAAERFNAVYHPPHRLTAQFRCSGSAGYMNWLDDVLQLRETGNYENWGDGQYEFRVFDRAEELYAALKEKNDRNKARLIAGYSWEWPKGGRSRGTDAKHVTVDGLSLPWNYDDENWASSPDGIEQVGCVHTSQGLEFDWMGVLIGADLLYKDGKVLCDPAKRARSDKSLSGWKKDLAAAKGDAAAEDAVRERVRAIIKGTYRVLMSRGRRGTFVWCHDSSLREYLKQRLALARTLPNAA